MKERWIVIPNWGKFQHYKTRDVPWIKLYTDLNSRPEWLALSTSCRGLLVTLWIEYARSAGNLRARSVLQLCAKSARSKHLEALSDAGFIEFSSRPLARARPRASAPSQELERELDPPKPPQGGPSKDLTKDLQPSARELRRYTGCRWVRGQIGATHKHDPLGTDKPPANWPYEKPSKDEILTALATRKHDDERSELAERQFEDEVEAAAEEINW